MSNQFKNVNGLDKRGRLRLVAPQALVDKLFPEAPIEDAEGNVTVGRFLKMADGSQGPSITDFQTSDGRVYIHAEPSSIEMERALLNGPWPANLEAELAFRQSVRVDNLVRDKVTQATLKTISAVVTKLAKHEQADAIQDGFVVVERDRQVGERGANLTQAGAEAAAGAPTGMTAAIATMSARARR